MRGCYCRKAKRLCTKANGPRKLINHAATGIGTPAGVSAVKPGDIVTAGLGDGIATIRFPVVAASAPQNL